MSKATATEIRVNKNITVPKRQNRVRTGSATAPAGHRADRHASPEFFESRESLYQLVDLIDYLFDGIIS